MELLIRLWLAKIFSVSGVLKLTHWQTVLELAAHEYPVRFLSPVAAAYLGVFIEALSPVLLAFGFMTRYAAVSMLGLSLVIQFAYRRFDSQLFWAALFGWYAVCGPSPISQEPSRVGAADRSRGVGVFMLPIPPTVTQAPAASPLKRPQGVPRRVPLLVALEAALQSTAAFCVTTRLDNSTSSVNIRGYTPGKQTLNPPRLAQTRNKPLDNRPTNPLFDTACFADNLNNLETAYMAIYDQYQTGSPTGHVRF